MRFFFIFVCVLQRREQFGNLAKVILRWLGSLKREKYEDIKSDWVSLSACPPQATALLETPSFMQLSSTEPLAPRHPALCWEHSKNTVMGSLSSVNLAADDWSLYTKHCIKCFVCIISLNLYSSPKSDPRLSPFSIQESWGPKRSNNCPQQHS